MVTNLAEKKYFDNELTSFAPINNAYPTADFFSLISDITQGVGVNQRVGNRIRITRIDFTIDVRGGQATIMAAGALCKLLIIHNRDCNSSAPNYADMYTGTSIFRQRKPEFTAKYRILKEMWHSLTSTATIGTGASSASGPRTCWKFSIPINKTIVYKASSSIAANNNYQNLTKDDIQFTAIASDTGCCNIGGFYRVYFTDF